MMNFNDYRKRLRAIKLKRGGKHAGGVFDRVQGFINLVRHFLRYYRALDSGGGVVFLHSKSTRENGFIEATAPSAGINHWGRVN
jgi:hypothetical protein